MDHPRFTRIFPSVQDSLVPSLITVERAIRQKILFEKGAKVLTPQNQISLPSIQDCGIAELEDALIKIQKLSASEKRIFLTACMAIAEHDGVISENEYQILRGLAAAISCPLGPILG